MHISLQAVKRAIDKSSTMAHLPHSRICLQSIPIVRLDLPLRSQRQIPILPLCRSPVKSRIPALEPEMKDSGEHDTHPRERHVRDVGLPVSRSLRGRIEITSVDGSEVGASVDDCICDSAFGRRAWQGCRDPGEDAAEGAVYGHHHEGRDVARCGLQSRSADDESD
jgi:hypothetical protein